MQTLVNHIQQAQVASQAGTSSPLQLAATPAATPQAVPLAAIAIPGAASNTGQVSEGMSGVFVSVSLLGCLPVSHVSFSLSLLSVPPSISWRMCALLSDSLTALAVCLPLCLSVAPTFLPTVGTCLSVYAKILSVCLLPSVSLSVL